MLVPVRRLPTQSRWRHFGGVSEEKTRSDHGPETYWTRGIMRPMRWARQRQTVLFRYSPSLSLKTLDTGISLLAVFKLVSLACAQSPPPQQTPRKDTPSPIFFWGEGAAVHRLSETDNPSSNCLSKFTEKIRPRENHSLLVRRIVHSKLKPFPFQIKTYDVLPIWRELSNG